MKFLRSSALLCSLFTAAGAFAQTTTWTAATNPHVVQGTYTVPVGQTLIMEPGVVVEIKSNSTLSILGQAFANGTATSHVTINGTSVATSLIDVKGTLDCDFTDVKSQVTPNDNGILIFADCTFSGLGTIFNGTVLQGGNTRAPYLQLDRCAFQGDGTFSSASLYVAYCTVVVRDTSFTKASYLSVSPGYLYVNNVVSDHSTQFGVDLGSDSDLFIDNVSVTSASLGGLKLSGDTRNGSNVLLGSNVTLQGNGFPVHLTIAGLYPESTIPATGNVNNSIHASEFAGTGGRWPKFAIPYFVDGAPLTVSDNFRIDPGVVVNMAPFSYINDIGFADGMRAFGTPTAPILFQRANPTQAWAFLHSDRTQGGRMRQVIVDGSSDGVNGGEWRLENCVFRNNGIGTNGGAIVSGSQYINNGTGHFTSGNLNSPTNPNSIAGNTVGADSPTDARSVWWGSPTGPRNSRNPGGTGDKLTSQITPFQPFLTTAPNFADTPPEVKLLRPSFQVYAGSQVTLRWEASDNAGIVSQQVLFSPIGNEVSGFQVVATLSPTERTYEWTVPAVVASADSYIKIVATDTTGKQGFDEWKVLVPTNDIKGTVTFGMTAGQTFEPGQFIPTVYTATNLDPYLTRTEFYLEDVRGMTRKMFGRGASGEGLPFYSTDTARYVVAYGDTANHGKYFYGPFFKIRPNTRLGDAPPAITLNTPSAGSTFSPGAVVPIGWTASDDEGLRGFDILASFDGARTWQPIVQNLDGNARSYNWQTATGSGSSDVRVLVIAKDWRFQSSSDGANRVFSTNGGGTTSDTVTIKVATYSASKSTLSVQASSSSGSTAVLQVFNTSTGALIGTLPASGRGNFRGVANPGNVTVKSSLGGSATVAVRTKR